MMRPSTSGDLPRTSVVRRRAAVVLSSLAFVLVALVSGTATPASAATAHKTGWHRVCANTLTVYNNGVVGVAYRYDDFYIDHFAGTHAWGTAFVPMGGARTPYGWVDNNWFC